MSLPIMKSRLFPVTAESAGVAVEFIDLDHVKSLGTPISINSSPFPYLHFHNFLRPTQCWNAAAIVLQQHGNMASVSVCKISSYLLFPVTLLVYVFTLGYIVYNIEPICALRSSHE